MDKKLQYFSGIFPDSSVCDLEFEIKKIVPSGENSYKQFVSEVRELCVGKKILNDVEEKIDFSSDDEVINFIKKESTHHFEVFDSQNDISVITFGARVYYGNIVGLSDDRKKMIKKGTIQTFFARIKV